MQFLKQSAQVSTFKETLMIIAALVSLLMKSYKMSAGAGFTNLQTQSKNILKTIYLDACWERIGLLISISGKEGISISKIDYFLPNKIDKTLHSA